MIDFTLREGVGTTTASIINLMYLSHFLCLAISLTPKTFEVIFLPP